MAKAASRKLEVRSQKLEVRNLKPEIEKRSPLELDRLIHERLPRKLEDAQYIACDKMFEGRVPRTEYRLTGTGRRALEKYLAHMEAIIKAVRD